MSSLLFFGKSGTGKTSLLNAGVFPKLREDNCLPFRIRFEFNDDSPDLITQIKQVLRAGIDKYGFKVEEYPGNETLWEYFHTEHLWEIVTPILIFDQFEEIFTLAGKSDRFNKGHLDNLIEELSDLIENNVPEKLKARFIEGDKKVILNNQKQKVKVLFAFREDFLAEMESITAKIPSVKYSRFRLKPFNGHQCFEVITKTWRNKIEPEEAKKIVYFLTNETETDNIEVENKYGKFDIIEAEPSLLSQVCSFIDEERIREGREKINAQFLTKYNKEITLRSLFNRVIDESTPSALIKRDKDSQPISNPLRLFIEEKLITNEGYRLKYKTNEIDRTIKPGIEALIGRYFIREENNHIELTHDVLTPLIKDDRDTRRKRLAHREERKKAFRRALVIVIAGLLIGVSIFGKALQETKQLTEENKKTLDRRTDSVNHIIDSLDAVIDSKKRNMPVEDAVKGGSDTIFTTAVVRDTIVKDNPVTVEHLNNTITELTIENTVLKTRVDSVRQLFLQTTTRYETLIKNLEIDLGTTKTRLTSCESIDRFGKITADQKKLYSRIDSLSLMLAEYKRQLNSCRLQQKKKFGYSYDYKEEFNPKLN